MMNFYKKNFWIDIKILQLIQADTILNLLKEILIPKMQIYQMI